MLEYAQEGDLRFYIKPSISELDRVSVKGHEEGDWVTTNERRRKKIQDSIGRQLSGSSSMTRVQDQLRGGVPSMESFGIFITEGIDLMYLESVVGRVILVGIACSVCGFDSIEAKRETSELFVPF